MPYKMISYDRINYNIFYENMIKVFLYIFYNYNAFTISLMEISLCNLKIGI